MGSTDDTCSVWLGLPTAGKSPLVSIPAHIKQIVCLGIKFALLTEEGRLVVLYKHGEYQFIDNFSQPSSTSEGCQQKEDGLQGEMENEVEVASLRFTSIVEEPTEKECLLGVTDSGEVVKINLENTFWFSRQESDMCNNVAALLRTSKSQLVIDKDNYVWSKGEVPYCGLLHSTETFQKIPFLSGHQVCQLQCGSDFTACVTTPKHAISPDTTLQLSDTLFSSNTASNRNSSCPLGVQLSPMLKQVQKNLDKSFNSDSSRGSQVSLQDNNSSSSDVTKTDIVHSALQNTTDKNVDSTESEQEESLDDKNDDVKTKTSTNDHQETSDSTVVENLQMKNISDCDIISEIDENCGTKYDDVDPHCRSSPVSLDDIYVKLGQVKSSSEPPPSQTSIHSDKGLKRCSSLTLNVAKSNTKLAAWVGTGGMPNNKICLQEMGSQLWQSQVWAWGDGARGQLGQGDMLPQRNPVPVQGINNQFIIKLSLGYQHALLLTGAGRVYGWGHNSSGQANQTDKFPVVLAPAQITLPKGETARDIQAVGNMSLILCYSGNIVVKGYRKNRSYTINKPAIENQHPCSILRSIKPTTLRQSTKSGSSEDDIYIINTFPANKDITKSRIAAAEIVLLDKVESVADLIQQLFIGSSGGTSNGSSHKKLEDDSLLSRVWHSLIRCRNFVSISVDHNYKEDRVNHVPDARGSQLIRSVHLWTELCLELGYNIGNCVVSSDCLLLDSDQMQHQHRIVNMLLHHFSWNRSNITGQKELELLLVELFNITLPYIQTFAAAQSSCWISSSQIKQCHNSLKSLHQALQLQKAQAFLTREFWEENTDSRLTAVRKDDQRLILDSKKNPVILASAYANHRFILFSDILVDIGYTKLSVHPLSCVWVEALSSTDSVEGKYLINLTMPEITKVLVCPDIQSRNLWLKNLTEAIQHELNGKKHCKIDTPYTPVTRNVKYTFTKGELKGCEYCGSMTSGRMQFKGTIKYTDASTYIGTFRNNVRHGLGKFTDADGNVKAGNWIDGKLTGVGRLKFSNGNEYEGDLVDGVPHGHGTMKCGRYVEDDTNMYIGAWNKGARHGYGVLETTSTGERYMGAWSEGLRHGHGCVVNNEGIYYEGNYRADKLTGTGFMIFEDGAVYEGEFSGAGEFHGNGVLKTKTDKFQGTFYGNYNDEMKFNGKVYRNNETNSETSTFSDAYAGLTQRFCVPNKDKWNSIFTKFECMLLETGRSAWENMSVNYHQNMMASASLNDNTKKSSNKKRKEFDVLETIPKVAKSNELSWECLCEIVDYLGIGAKCSAHPLYHVFNQIIQCFNASYGGLRSHSILLSHAKDELRYMCATLYNILRHLFPVLPVLHVDQQVHLPRPTKQTDDNSFNDENRFVLNTDWLLFPLLFPSIYPALFHLYIEKEDVLDREYQERIKRWNKHTDAALLTFFDVDITAWQLQIDRRSRDSVFLEAIYDLQRLKTKFTPFEKLEVIVSVFKSLTSGQNGVINVTLNMDMLLPVCMYIIVRSRVLQLGAELHMVDDFIGDHLRQGMEGITFVTLQAAYTQIRRESVFIS